MLLRVEDVMRRTGFPRRTVQRHMARMSGVMCLLGERGGPLAIEAEDYAACLCVPVEDILGIDEWTVAQADEAARAAQAVQDQQAELAAQAERDRLARLAMHTRLDTQASVVTYRRR